jgi:hypothetical protein
MTIEIATTWPFRIDALRRVFVKRVPPTSPVSPSRRIPGSIQGRKSVCMLPSDALADFLLQDPPPPSPETADPAPEPTPEPPGLEVPESTPEPDAPVTDTDTDTHATAVVDAMSLEESYIIRIREEAELHENVA